MTIDQRLEALTERHEALTQSVELMNHQLELINHQLETDAKHIREIARIAQTSNESINALLRIAESHERRLTQLDGGEQ